MLFTSPSEERKGGDPSVRAALRLAAALQTETTMFSFFSATFTVAPVVPARALVARITAILAHIPKCGSRRAGRLNIARTAVSAARVSARCYACTHFVRTVRVHATCARRSRDLRAIRVAGKRAWRQRDRLGDTNYRNPRVFPGYTSRDWIAAERIITCSPITVTIRIFLRRSDRTRSTRRACHVHAAKYVRTYVNIGMLTTDGMNARPL